MSQNVSRRRRWIVQIVDTRDPWTAPMDILRRRAHLKTFRLGRYRAFIVGRLPL
jgi:hypothetical protein